MVPAMNLLTKSFGNVRISKAVPMNVMGIQKVLNTIFKNLFGTVQSRFNIHIIFIPRMYTIIRMLVFMFMMMVVVVLVMMMEIVLP
jgi:hypothetical protein